MNYLEGTSGKLTTEAINGSLSTVLEVFRQFRPTLLEKTGNIRFIDKNDGSPVTAMDMEIEVALQAALEERYPGMPVFGEETGYGNNLPAAFWLVDPIDGTKSFVEGTPAFTSMAVLIQGGEAVASLIYNPSTDDVYTAQKGQGAYKNETHLDIAALPLASTALCKEHLIPEINKMLAPKAVTCEAGPSGGGFGFTMVLDGLAAARFNLQGGGYTHDYAPGALLVMEAGGAIVPILDDTYTYESRSFVACHPELEATLLPHVPALRALETLQRSK